MLFNHADTDGPRELPPFWNGTEERPRILVEHPDPVVRAAYERVLGAHGYAVLTCSGPRPDGTGRVSCPVLRQEPCEAVEGANLVLCGLDPTQVINRVIRHRIEQPRPGGPVVCRAEDLVALLPSP